MRFGKVDQSLLLLYGYPARLRLEREKEKTVPLIETRIVVGNGNLLSLGLSFRADGDDVAVPSWNCFPRKFPKLCEASRTFRKVELFSGRSKRFVTERFQRVFCFLVIVANRNSSGLLRKCFPRKLFI